MPARCGDHDVTEAVRNAPDRGVPFPDRLLLDSVRRTTDVARVACCLDSPQGFIDAVRGTIEVDSRGTSGSGPRRRIDDPVGVRSGRLACGRRQDDADSCDRPRPAADPLPSPVRFG